MYDLTIELHSDGSRCLYEQIYQYIRKEIREGKLRPGERLPSTRSLAEYLQISRSTATLAYDQLQSEGYIISRPYRGYYVCHIEELFRMDAEGEVHGIGNGRTDGDERNYRCDFSPAATDMSLFPFSVWRKITRNVLSDDSRELFARGDAQGEYSLRETISRYLHSSRGVNCSPMQIVVGAGNDYLLLLLEKILGRHVRIAMENPTYKRAYRIFRSFADEISTVDMDEAGMSVAGLRQSDVTVAYVMPAHQYPTGMVMPIGRRLELLKWADEAPERYLIEDDYDSEFRYKGKPIPSLQASDKHGKVIYMGTFSKSIAPAIRVSYMVLPQTLLERYRQQCYFYSTTVSRIDQKVLEIFIAEGYFERYLNRMRKHYKEKHDLMLEGLEDFQKSFQITGENAGLHLLLTSREGQTEEALTEAAQAVGVKVYGLSESLVEQDGTQPSRTVLLGYGGLEREEIIKGLTLLRQAWL
ncbi:MAG: PLP-dependent aminotransferase family protein [bacterium]|nr:PLP-dependent aminotransferase family protein [bacterium]MCM1373830.1 PLP-dependent aminotransferase family protein [Muribaculum sp.]